jgi:hypothetical protein
VTDAGWTAWEVAPQSGFRVRGAVGRVSLTQVDDRQFRVATSFEFADPGVRERLLRAVVRSGRSSTEAARMVDDACTYTSQDTVDDDTDLASIPPFMRWFVNSYGTHTLAAIIHDTLIGAPANSGALGSDTLADQFFREMMRCAGVPWLKRWIMWAAVAMRTRWAAGGYRRVTLVLWGLLATAGISAFAWGAATQSWTLLVVAAVMPFVAGVLWFRQYGASLVAAVAALWILPPALLAAAGYLVYRVLERAASAARLR